MKKLITGNGLTQCDMVRIMLESNGIRCFIKNEYSSTTAGAGLIGPLNFAAPELWVIDDEQFADAEEVLRLMDTEEYKNGESPDFNINR